MKKEDYKILGIGFIFSTVYVGLMAFLPVVWACLNLAVLIIALIRNYEKRID